MMRRLQWEKNPDARPRLFLAAAALTLCTLAGCGTFTQSSPPRSAQAPGVAKVPGSTPRSGGYYLDDGPGDSPPPDIAGIPDAVPRLEPLHRGSARPYVVMGRSYAPMTALGPYKGRGVASWYGRRYHGKQTSSGEIYDMYGMSAAHTTLPIPSYVRVTNVASGKSVVVRVNDRGPFIDGRLIDLSYSAAYKLGVLAGGSAVVEVELLDPRAPASLAAALAPPAVVETAPASAPVAAPMSVERLPALADAAAPGMTPPENRPAPPPAAAAGAYYVQLGAFGSPGNAEALLNRLKPQADALGERLQIVPQGSLYRVYAGPYPGPAESRKAAERLGEAFGIKPIVTSR
jgi:rare lipoprotein A